MDNGQGSAVVVARELTRRYGEGDYAVDALRGVSVDIEPGKMTAVMGPSGSGKSTLMHILAGLDKPTSGDVTIAGTEITGLGDNDLTKLRREHIGFVFQFFNLLPMLTAKENVLLPLTIAGEKVDGEWFDGLADRIGLTDRLTHRPAELSGGQQQRVAIARALVSTPHRHLRGRAHRQPRLHHEPGDPRADARLRRRVRADHRDGHPRSTCRRDGRQGALSRRRCHRQRHPAFQPARDLAGDGSVDPGVIRFAVKGLAGRKLRTALTAVAIVLGVAMVSGTYVLTDSISSAFNAIFEQQYANTDAVITGEAAFDLGQSGTTTAPPFSESVLAEVKALPDVRAALGGVGGEAQLIGANGKAIVFGGAPNLGFSVDPTQPEFNSLTLVSGAWPTGGEVVIDTATASKKNLAAGQEIGVQAEGAVEKFRISGLVKFGSVDTIGGATLAGFDLPTAQRLFDKQGKLDQIRVAAKAGVSPDTLVAQIESILPQGAQVKSGNTQAESDSADTNSFITILQTFLLAFGGIALFVGAFVIANSLSITIAQRTREFATLRTLGASRRQVLGSVIVEALVIGVIASVVGLVLGIGLGKGLFRLFDAVGFTLPNNGITVESRTIVVALAVGILVTLIASLRPAVRATRVPPIAAVREGATLPEGRFHRYRGAGAAATALLGLGCAPLRPLRQRPRHETGADRDRDRRPADLHRSGAVLRPSRRPDGPRYEPPGSLVRLRARGHLLALLDAALLVAPARRLRPGERVHAGDLLRRRCHPEPVPPRHRAPDAVALRGRQLEPRVAGGVPGRDPRPRHHRDRGRELPAKPATHGLYRRRADDRPRSRNARRDPCSRNHRDVQQLGRRSRAR